MSYVFPKLPKIPPPQPRRRVKHPDTPAPRGMSFIPSQDLGVTCASCQGYFILPDHKIREAVDQVCVLCSLQHNWYPHSPWVPIHAHFDSCGVYGNTSQGLETFLRSIPAALQPYLYLMQEYTEIDDTEHTLYLLNRWFCLVWGHGRKVVSLSFLKYLIDQEDIQRAICELGIEMGGDPNALAKYIRDIKLSWREAHGR